MKPSSLLKRTKPWLRMAAALLVGLWISGMAEIWVGCATAPPPPPPPKVEVKPPRPHARAVWVPGHWQWKGRRRGYVWVPGHWVVR
jgi:hypothetical protein